MMIGIDMTFIRKNEINKGFFSEGISIYCEQILRGFEKIGKSKQFVLLVFKDQEETIRQIFPDYSIRVIESSFVQFARKIFGKNILVDTEHRYLKKNAFAEQVMDLDAIWFPFAIDKTFCKCSVPTICTIHDLILYQNGNKKVKQAYRNGLIKYSNRIVTISNSVKTEISKTFNYTKAIDVVPNAVDYVYSSQTRIVKEIEGHAFILDVNAFTERKNTLTLLKAYKIVEKSINENLVLCGGYKDDYYYDEIQEFIRNNNLGKRVYVYFNLDEAAKNYLFSTARLFVMPSVAEGFGRTPIEAAMRKIPVVCSDIPVLREVMLGKAIYYKPPKDENELANAILTALETHRTDGELEKISKDLQKYYSTEKCAKKYTEIFEQICAGECN